MPLSARYEALLDLLIEQTVGPYLGTAIRQVEEEEEPNGEVGQ